MPQSERRLAATVHLTNPETGGTEIFGPDDEVPDWAAEQITNDGAWASDGSPGVGEEGGPPVPGRAQSAREEEVRRASMEETGKTYGEWKADDLRAELKDRGLSTEGKKDELVARLAESDQG